MRLKQLQKCRGDPKKGRICKKGGMLLVWVFFSSWALANVTIVTFNYILVIVLLFPFSFHSFSFCYRSRTSCLHHAGVTSCFSLNMHIYSYGQPIMTCFYMMGLGGNFIMREVASSAGS